MVKTPASTAGGLGSIPGRGTKIPHATGPKNEKKPHKTPQNPKNLKLNLLMLVGGKKEVR